MTRRQIQSLSMLKNEKKTVQFIGINPTRALHRYVERQVERWIEREELGLAPQEDVGFHVKIQRDESGVFYSCAIEIKINSKEWRSYESDRNLHDALKKSIQGLKSADKFEIHDRGSGRPFENQTVA